MNLEEVLSTWVTLNNALRNATEAECSSLLAHEKANRKRTTVLLRVYGRFNQLRGERERRELITLKG